MLSDPGNLSSKRSLNFIRMAKKAMQNGNLFAARSHAQKAINLIKPRVNDSLLNPDSVPENPGPETYEEPSKKDLPEEETTKHFYRDVSTGQAVSFKYGGYLTGPQSFLGVPAHEREHVWHAVSRAILRGDGVNTSVSYKVRYDPKTGEPYVAGGVTRVKNYPEPKKM